MMITKIFNKTAQVLHKIAQKLNLTYNEVNIIVYYMLVPLTWLVMLDFIIKIWPLLTIVWIATCLTVSLWHRKDFKTWCDNVFQKSVDFLLWFKHFGWDYNKASVIICVIVPIFIYVILTLMLLM